VRTTTIQVARILRDALEPGDLARVSEALEGYLVEHDPEARPPNPTVARRTDVACDLVDRIEALIHEAGPGGGDPAPSVNDAPATPQPGDPLADALRHVDECLDRAEGAAERLRGEDGRSVREAIDDASGIVARALGVRR
jgi:hypothetical protein